VRRRDDDSGEAPRRRPEPSSARFNSPFRDLDKLVGPLPNRPARDRAPARRQASQPRVDEPKPDDEALFQAAVRGVVPIPVEERGRPTAPAPRPSPSPVSEEDEALAELSDLVSGATGFDVSDAEEHVEGMVVGLDPRILRRLRAGEFAYQAHLDLHGMTAGEAKEAVRAFVLRSMTSGHRCLLLVHGRGRNSPDQRPVLKDAVKQWLTRGELARRVLAFSTARPYDGGSGATYVLLRRERRGKKPFHTLVGAKS
jgi:DNA-nicking Smr family endonuclease